MTKKYPTRRPTDAGYDGPNNAGYLMENTGCYLSFTIGHSGLTGVTAAEVADAIAEYCPERITADTDCANTLRTDPSSTKRAILELSRRGVDEEDIRRVVL